MVYRGENRLPSDDSRHVRAAPAFQSYCCKLRRR